MRMMRITVNSAKWESAISIFRVIRTNFLVKLTKPIHFLCVIWTNFLVESTETIAFFLCEIRTNFLRSNRPKPMRFSLSNPNFCAIRIIFHVLSNSDHAEFTLISVGVPPACVRYTSVPPLPTRFHLFPDELSNLTEYLFHGIPCHVRITNSQSPFLKHVLVDFSLECRIYFI